MSRTSMSAHLYPLEGFNRMAAPSSLSRAATIDAQDYRERVYAGVLGKIIGVYLGRPFEGWTHEKILRDLGEVDRYVNDRIAPSERRAGLPVVVTDDDIAGTFTFFRALEDNGYDPSLTPAQIGEAWLNYLIEERTVLWWGGLGVSTEHTAYLRLKSGIAAPESGSISRNGTTIAEQIGSQIFIDAWPMLFPGDPERAVDFARRAASVSHDGEAIYGAQVVAAIEAQAFVEPDIDALIDTAVGLIPADSTIARLIADIREWHARDDDWYATRALIGERYGYDSYPGNCHMVPNHALIIHALLHGNDDFRRSLMIVNTCGWDTDCNSGNVGAILGVKQGLAAFDAVPDLRDPVADRLYLSTADGGRAISDAVRESDRIIYARQALHGEPYEAPKGGARFHFSFPGAMQGFRSLDGAATVGNTPFGEGRSLSIRLNGASASVTTPTFIPEEARAMVGYELFASPTLYPGQTVVARVAAAEANTGPVSVALTLQAYGAADALETHTAEARTLAPGEQATLSWRVPDLQGAPVAEFGLRVEGPAGAAVLVDALDWRGAPTVTFTRPGRAGGMARRAWVNGVDEWNDRWLSDFQVSQNHGRGLISQGTEEWDDYAVSARIEIPLAEAAGLAARVGGLRRYYAITLCNDGVARLVRARGDITTMAERQFAWEPDRAYDLSLTVRGNRLRATIDGEVVLEATDDDRPYLGGGVGLVAQEGTIVSGPITVMAR